MSSEPEVQDGYVAYEQGDHPALYDPTEAEELALSLLGCAQQARAYRMAQEMVEQDGETGETGRENTRAAGLR